MKFCFVLIFAFAFCFSFGVSITDAKKFKQEATKWINGEINCAAFAVSANEWSATAFPLTNCNLNCAKETNFCKQNQFTQDAYEMFRCDYE